MTTVFRWTGREAKLLQQALQLGVRGFDVALSLEQWAPEQWAEAAGPSPGD